MGPLCLGKAWKGLSALRLGVCEGGGHLYEEGGCPKLRELELHV